MDSLQQIIKSLTPNEKRYIKVFASAFKTESGLEKLFDVLDAKEEYDEKAVKKKSGSKNLTEAKSELRKLLFKAMRNYREDVSVKQQLRDAISDVEFLERKNLLGEATKELNKATKLAEKSDEHYYLIELYMRSGWNALTTSKPDVILPHFDELRKQLEFSIHETSYFQRGMMMSHSLSAVIRSNNYKSAADVNFKIEKIGIEMRGVLKHLHSPYYRIILLTAIIFCEQKNNLAKTDCEEVMTLFEENKDIAPRDPVVYIGFLNTYIQKLVYDQNYPALILQLFQKAEAAFITHHGFLIRHPDKLKSVRNKFNSMRLFYMFTNHAYKQLDDVEQEVKKQLEKESERKQVVNAINTSLLTTCFLGKGDFEKSKEWINIYYALPEAAHRKALMVCVRFNEVVVFYKTNEYAISDTKAINLYKSLIEQKYEDDYHKHLGTLLRKLNHWVLKKKSDRAEVESLINCFRDLRKNSDLQYLNYYSHIKPDEMLEELLKK